MIEPIISTNNGNNADNYILICKKTIQIRLVSQSCILLTHFSNEIDFDMKQQSKKLPGLSIKKHRRASIAENPVLIASRLYARKSCCL